MSIIHVKNGTYICAKKISIILAQTLKYLKLDNNPFSTTNLAYISKLKYTDLGRSCSSVGRAVAFDTRDSNTLIGKF